MIRSDNAMSYEDGYLRIQDYINEYFDDIVSLLLKESHAPTRAKFVELIGDSMIRKSIPILEKELLYNDVEVRSWAWNSLMSLNMEDATSIALDYKAKHPKEEFYM